MPTLLNAQSKPLPNRGAFAHYGIKFYVDSRHLPNFFLLTVIHVANHILISLMTFRLLFLDRFVNPPI